MFNYYSGFGKALFGDHVDSLLVAIPGNWVANSSKCRLHAGIFPGRGGGNRIDPRRRKRKISGANFKRTIIQKQKIFILELLLNNSKMIRIKFRRSVNQLLGLVHTWRTLTGVKLNNNWTQYSRPAIFWQRNQDTEPERPAIFWQRNQDTEPEQH